MPPPIITLTTDFGSRDGYVGAMKGVLLRRGPCTVVDIAHDIPRGDVAHAAWVVATSTRYFPAGTLHVVVVDPGVGSARRGVVVRDEAQYYVGPDNGSFAYLEADAVHTIENEDLLARDVSNTFHGRDVFAPIAAYLAGELTMGGEIRERTLANVGRRGDALVGLPWGERSRGEGRIVHIDHFGNLISDLPAEEVLDHDAIQTVVLGISIAGQHVPLVRTYSDVAPNQLLAYIGSAGTVEIAVRDGRADRMLAVPRGTPVTPAEPSGPFR